MHGNPLNRDEIASLIASEIPLLQGYISLQSQLQPNGFDLSLRDVSEFVLRQAQDGRDGGQLGADNADRELAEASPLAYDADGWTDLSPGPYLVTFNEVVNLPLDIMALGRPRSSLLRSGASLHTAVWDAGYRGRSQSLLTVHHPAGFRLQRDARLAQLVFFRLSIPPSAGYQGRYQGEGL